MLMTLYAVVALVGLGNIIVDVGVNIRDFIYRPVATKAPAESVPHWASVLYVGSSVAEEIERSASLAVALAAHDRFANGQQAGDEGREFDLELLRPGEGHLTKGQRAGLTRASETKI